MSDLNSPVDLPWKKQKLAVTRDDATVFAVPPVDASGELISQNRQRLDPLGLNIQGRTLERLRRWTRETVIRAACEYTSQLVSAPVEADTSSDVVVSGHQPELFHTGVWSKNFALHRLALSRSGVGLNLVVDNDMCASTEIRVPCGTRENPFAEKLAFDSSSDPRPWEESSIHDLDLFRSFGDRAAEAMNRWNIDPLIQSVWDDAVKHSSHSERLADCLTAARHRLERRWGLRNLELPISRLCQQEPFLWFASHLFAHAPRFLKLHNEILHEYKKLYHIRSSTHPVPELHELEGWTETPFWMWRVGSQARLRVYAQQNEREVWLSDGNDVFAKMPLSPDMDACCAVEVLQKLPAQGIRLRTRALTTTLFSRLCLGDLFIHGIGGAKYDEMTDQIIARFWNLVPPEFSVLSATLFLPIVEPFNVGVADQSKLQGLLRDIHFNPDRHIDVASSSELRQLVEQKESLVAQQHAAKTTGLSRKSRRNNRQANFQRYRKLQDVRQQLQQYGQEQRQLIESDLETVTTQLSANSILKDREFSFCLYPESHIRDFLSRI